MSPRRQTKWWSWLAPVAATLLSTLLLAGGSADAALAQTGGSYDLTWSTVDGGGATFSTGGAFSLGGTIGQPDAGQLSGGDYSLTGGFWSGAANPTAVTLAGFWVEARGQALAVCWETATELETLGFHLYRSDTGATGRFARLTETLLPGQAPGSPSGAIYEWVDSEVEEEQTYFYLLEALDVYGQATRYGPVSATLPPVAPYRSYLPLVNR
ncbi:MAG: hypothetical protein P8129_23375 [Anaerolineae bacterium]